VLPECIARMELGVATLTRLISGDLVDDGPKCKYPSYVSSSPLSGLQQEGWGFFSWASSADRWSRPVQDGCGGGARTGSWGRARPDYH
jgi:hypothetical protein